MKINLHSPENYDHGAYRVVVELEPSERELAQKYAPVAFTVPKLPQRLITFDHGYRVAVPRRDSAGKIDITICGVFKDGEWHGDVYTNGISEDRNPTSIDTVKSAITDSVEGMLAMLRDWNQM